MTSEDICVRVIILRGGVKVKEIMSDKDEKLWIDYVPLKKLKKWPRNPKLHDGEGISESIDRFGFTDPILIDEKTGMMVAGHGRLEQLTQLKKAKEDPPANVIIMGKEWTVPVIRGNSFANEQEVEAYLLTCNRLVEKGGWDEELLEAMIQVVHPIGFDEIAANMQENVDQAIEDAPDVPEYPGGLEPTHTAANPGVGDVKVTKDGIQPGETYYQDERRDTPDFEDIPGHLQGVFQLANEDTIFTSSHELGIPDLLPNMILPEIPKDLKTWGGRRETPDDGVSTYLFVHGTASGIQCPWKRTLIGWWTHDVHIKSLLEIVPYRTGQLINSGVIGSVVPDVSLWKGNPLVLHMLAIYQAAWVGRYFQESGIKVIPRFEYFLPECKEFSLAGIPKGTPTIATQLHTGFTEESIPEIKKSLIEGLGIIRPGQILLYVSNRGANLIDDIRKDLPVEEIVMVPTVKTVRRKLFSGTEAEPDPYLRKLRQRKGQWRGKSGEVEDEETSEVVSD